MSQTVPAAEDMDDLTFVRHMHKRHRVDFPHWTSMTEAVDADRVNLKAEWVAAWRVFHERCHSLRLHNYDHDHTSPRIRSAS